MQIIDSFCRNKEVTIRLTSVFAEHSATYIGISIDPPFQDWDITDVTIVDDLGRTYWVSITRDKSGDPFFPIRLITDVIRDDVTQLMISIRRIYLPDRQREEVLEQLISLEEQKVFDAIQPIGIDAPLAAHINDFSKKIRELERKRFFELPVVLEEIAGPWSFAFKIDHSIRKRINRKYKLLGNISFKDAKVSALEFRTGILKNELICSYTNQGFRNNIYRKDRIKNQDENLIFPDSEFFPAPPQISLREKQTGILHFPWMEGRYISDRDTGNIIIADTGELKLSYQFESFDYEGGDLELLVHGYEIYPEEELILPIDVKDEICFDIPLINITAEQLKAPLKINVVLEAVIGMESNVLLEIICKIGRLSKVGDLYVSGCTLNDQLGNIYRMNRKPEVKIGNEIEAHYYYEIPLHRVSEKFFWTIQSLFWSLTKPIATDLEILEIY